MQGTLDTLLRSYAAKFVAVTVLYAAALVISYHLIPASSSGVSLVWPPAALGLVALLFLGIDLWPAIAVAFFIVLYFRGVYPPLIAISAIGNVAESVVAVYILRRYVDFSPMLNRLRDTLGLVIAAVVASAVSASVITGGVVIFNQRPGLNVALWVSLWIGHLVSLISFGPFAIRWLHRPLFTKTSAEIVEGTAVFGSIFTLCILLFWTPYSSVAGISLFYMLIMPLIWAALRTGPRGTSLALFMFAAISTTGILFGFGGFGSVTQSPNLDAALFGIQMIIGTLSLIFLLFSAITEERKEAIINLRGHVGKLEVALNKTSSEDKAKADFIAILAHELRNPLSPILSGLELLKLEEKGRPEVLHMMGAHLHTIARLLDDLLDITRISQKKFTLQKEPVEVRAVLSRALEMVQPQVAARRHTLQVLLPEEEVWLHGDPVRLTQIFANLLTNSAKYTDAGGSIELRAERRGNVLVVLVKDNGIGIAPERLSAVFEPFGRPETAISQHQSGLHIGLSLAKRMAEMHHGIIHAHSEGVGTGTTVTVEIPLPPTPPLAMPESKKAPVRSRFFKEGRAKSAKKLAPVRILVVDDNEPAARGLGALLEHYGHQVLLAYNAPEALALAAQHRPDIALLDIGLPTMDGYELARKMRSAAEHPLFCVALTGYGQTEDKQKAKDAGFDGHLVKPVSIIDVERVLAELHSK